MIKTIKNNDFNISKSYSNNGIYYSEKCFIKNVKQIDISSFWPMIAYNLGFLDDKHINLFLKKINNLLSDIEIKSVKKELVIYIGKLNEEKRKEINNHAINFIIYLVSELKNNNIKVMNIINDGLIIEDNENKSLSIIKKIEKKYKKNCLKFHYDEYQYGLILNSQEYLLFDFDEENNTIMNFKNKLNFIIDENFLNYLSCLINKEIKGVQNNMLNINQTLQEILMKEVYNANKKSLKFIFIEDIIYKGNRLSKKDFDNLKNMIKNKFYKVNGNEKYFGIENDGQLVNFYSDNFDIEFKLKLYSEINNNKIDEIDDMIYSFNLFYKYVKNNNNFKKMFVEEFINILEKNNILNLSNLEYKISKEFNYIYYCFLKNKKYNDEKINNEILKIGNDIFKYKNKLSIKNIKNKIESSSNLFIFNNQFVFFDFSYNKWSKDIDNWIYYTFLSNIDDIKKFNSTKKEITEIVKKELSNLKNDEDFIQQRTIEETGFLDKNNNLYVFENGKIIKKQNLCLGFSNKKYDIDMDNVLKSDIEFDKKIDLLLNQVCNHDNTIKDSVITYLASSLLPNNFNKIKEKLNNVLMVNGVAHSAKSTLFNLFSEILGDSCKHLSDIKLDDNILNMLNEINVIIFDDIPEFNKKGCVLNKKHASVLSGLVNGDEFIYKKLYNDKATTNFLIYPIIINNYPIIINNENIKRRNIQFSVNNTIEENKEYLENVSGSDLNNPRMKDALFRILLKREQELISNVNSIENMTKNDVNNNIFNIKEIKKMQVTENTSSIKMMLDDLEIPSIDFLYGIKRKDLFDIYKRNYFGKKEISSFEDEILNSNDCEFKIKKMIFKNKESLTIRGFLCPVDKSKEKAIKEFYLKWSNFFDSKKNYKEMDIISISELFKLMNNSNNEFKEDVKHLC